MDFGPQLTMNIKVVTVLTLLGPKTLEGATRHRVIWQINNTYNFFNILGCLFIVLLQAR